MQGKETFQSSACCKSCNHAIAVTSNVLKCCITIGLFVKMLNGHYGKELVDSPRVWKALEKGEVAVIFVCQQFVQPHQFFWNLFQSVGNGVDLACDAPINAFNLCACFQVNQSVAEEV